MRDEVGELDTSFEEWKEALYPPDDPGLTITELAEVLFVSESAMRRRLKSKIGDGTVTKGCAFRSGRRCIVYQLVKGEENR